MALVGGYSNTAGERHGEHVSESNLPPESWRPLFDRAGIEFGFRPLANRSGLTHTRVHRLIRGGGTTNEAIEQVAEVLGVAASKIRELRGEPAVEVDPFTLPDEAGRLTDSERAVIRSMVRALLNARDGHAERDATQEQGTQGEAGEGEKIPDNVRDLNQRGQGRRPNWGNAGPPPSVEEADAASRRRKKSDPPEDHPNE